LRNLLSKTRSNTDLTSNTFTAAFPSAKAQHTREPKSIWKNYSKQYQQNTAVTLGIKLRVANATHTVQNEEEGTAEETTDINCNLYYLAKQYYKTTPTYRQEKPCNYNPSNTINLEIEKLCKRGEG